MPVKGILSWLCNLLCFHWYVMNSSKLCVCISLYACMQTNNTMWRWMVLCTWLEAILFLACQDFAFLLYLSFFLPQETCHPIMCSYKVVKVFFEVWGLQGRVESGVHNVSQQTKWYQLAKHALFVSSALVLMDCVDCQCIISLFACLRLCLTKLWMPN